MTVQQSQEQPLPTREQIGDVASDPRTLLALEALFKQGNTYLPSDVASIMAILNSGKFVLSEADSDLPDSRVLNSPSVGLTIDLTAAGLIKLVLDALANLNALAVIAFTKAVTMASGLGVTGGTLTDTLHATGAATLGGGVGVTGGAIVLGGANVTGGLTIDNLRLNVAPTASATASDHSVPINVNGTVFYMRLSATP